MKQYIDCLKKYATFSGRASRKEFWFFVLFNIIFTILAQIVDACVIGSAVFYPIYTLAVLLPGLAVSVRRLHDTGRSGWMLLLGLIPLIGAIILVVFYAQPSKDAGDKYGPAPQSIA